MPELPEVETFKRYLDKTSLKQKINNVTVSDNRVLSVDARDLRKSVKNKQFESSIRHGKYLLVFLKPKYLVLHFGMTGDLEYYLKKAETPKFSKVIFQFSNDFNLAYISRRMFGRVSIADSIEDFVEKKKLGPDAYKMSIEQFRDAVKRRTGIIKNVLLNQSFVAGIGNIYSDEILFKTKIHPKTKIDTLNENQIEDMFANIKAILKLGIGKEGVLSTYPDDYLIPHRKKEHHCPICDSEIARLEIAGRHGFYCPKCQKK
ncbi:MAG: Fpg/Nei family DNA glycosylase [Promethearchaeota archaeon]|jgi:formamidopyrimidine-DNA glycosylase